MPKKAHSPLFGHNLPAGLGLKIKYIDLADVILPENPLRKHSGDQIKKIARSISEFGNLDPILVDEDFNVISGVARLLAAKRLELPEVPVISINHLSRDQINLFRIADNRLAELGEWDKETLARELMSLENSGLDIDLTGFEVGEIDLLIDNTFGNVPEICPDSLPPTPEADEVFVKAGDLWLLGDHRIFCGNALKAESFHHLLADDKADLIFTDHPYNVPINGNVCGKGAIHHEEFVMASGEMSEEEFETFLNTSIALMVAFSRNGSVHYMCMDWRHLDVLLRICNNHYSTHLNICVWAKTNAGMGSFYRSQHELVVVFRKGKTQHINNVMLGKYGRNRTNVWGYPGVNIPQPGKKSDLQFHPTVKPVALVADAIRDATHPGDIVLDPFCGSGTTILAAEETRRRAFAIEIEPKYVQVAINRWEVLTGLEAHRAVDDFTLKDISRARKLLLLPPPKMEKADV